MKMLILASAVVLTGCFAGTALGQCQGGSGRGMSGGMQGQGRRMMSMQGMGQSSGMNPTMAQAMMQQQAFMQQAYMQQMIAAAQEKERIRQEKKEKHIANVKQRKASEDARRADKRAQLVASLEK